METTIAFEKDKSIYGMILKFVDEDANDDERDAWMYAIEGLTMPVDDGKVRLEKGLKGGKLGPKWIVFFSFLLGVHKKGRDARGKHRLKFPYTVFRRCYE
jgi:hypothetical protein